MPLLKGPGENRKASYTDVTSPRNTPKYEEAQIGAYRDDSDNKSICSSEKDMVSVPSQHGGWSVSNSSTRGSCALSWLPQAPGINVRYIQKASRMLNTHKVKLISILNFCHYENHKLPQLIPCELGDLVISVTAEDWIYNQILLQMKFPGTLWSILPKV